MAEPYLTELETIISRLLALHNDTSSVTCKHFFGGAAAYVDDKIFMSLSPVGLALKLSQDDCASLFGQGAVPLRYFPKAPVKKGYAVLPPKLVGNEDELMTWILRSVEYAN